MKSYFVDINGSVYAELDSDAKTDRIAVPPGYSILTEDMLGRVGNIACKEAVKDATYSDTVMKAIGLTVAVKVVESEEISKR